MSVGRGMGAARRWGACGIGNTLGCVFLSVPARLMMASGVMV
ncbi:hypothetical protein [Xylella fastidiosa]|nr:hypothetical protein [Xylella fastidiosa]WNY18897.1 hypothetical protein RO839_10605 [Xylella fastidiosa]WNY21185.1 hypothetical protein RO838_10625 [Xylella fastidiosa]